MKHELTF